MVKTTISLTKLKNLYYLEFPKPGVSPLIIICYMFTTFLVVLTAVIKEDTIWITLAERSSPSKIEIFKRLKVATKTTA